MRSSDSSDKQDGPAKAAGPSPSSERPEPIWVGGDPAEGGELPVCRGGSRRPYATDGGALEGSSRRRVPTDPEEIALDDRALAGLGHGCRGLFITFEGLDGTGKSTQLEILASALRGAGHEVVIAREPGGTPLGEAIRDALLDPANAGMSPRAEAFLYTAARVQLVEEVIRPALEAGRIVLCDRYVDSSLAYQGYGRDLGYENIISMNMWATDGLMPDLTIVLMAPEKVRRRRLSDTPDRLEGAGDDFYRRVEEGYRRLVADHPHRMVAVDAGGSVEEVASRVRRAVEEELPVEIGV
ncbi:MAG: hypothetical protein Kow00129_00900 [Thermoleophilia bacterium]